MKSVFKFTPIILLPAALLFTACKKEGCTDEKAQNFNSKAKKDDGSCTYAPANTYTIPSTFVFTDANGNSTVNYSGQTDRLNQLREMVTYMKTGTTTILSATVLKDMFANTNGNANGAFSFTSSKQLRDKCFDLDQVMYENYMDMLAATSNSFGNTASSGNAGVLTSGTSSYLFDQNGVEYRQLIEKGLMGAVFMYQALNVYFGSGKMNVDNTTAVDPTNGLYYTAMEHHWDEAFGYLGVPVDFPATVPTDFWGSYCDEQNLTLGSNTAMMSNFLKGRAAISNNVLADRDAAIQAIREMWEKISAYQAMAEIDEAINDFADPAMRLHEISEAYAFILCLRYVPVETRKMTNSEVTALLDKFGSNFWNLSITQLQNIKADLDAKY